MALRFRRLRDISIVLPLAYSGDQFRVFVRGGIVNAVERRLFASHNVCTNNGTRLECTGFHVQRYTTGSKRKHKPRPEVDLLSFILSSFVDVRGSSHLWLNIGRDRMNFTKDGVYLVLASNCALDSLLSSRDLVPMFEIVKKLQQRYPSLQVLGLQYNVPTFFEDVCNQIFEKTLRDYITFPILLSNKNFLEMADGACYVLFKGFKSPLILHEKDVDLVTLDQAVKELIVQTGDNPISGNKLKSTWAKPTEAVKEPYLCSALQNLLLYYPGCISVDADGNRVFLSDSNHHRIIVSDTNGKILDCIGSSPGLEDGDFEQAKLMRPAASLYNASEDCLYFVDSENHAIRRADMEMRIVETVYPRDNSRKTNSIWNWILDKFWIKRNVETKSEEFDSDSFMFPWHLVKLSDHELFVLNQSLETLWTVDLASGTIREVTKGFSKILERCGQMIMEKSTAVKHIPSNWLQQVLGTNNSPESIPYADMMSTTATVEDHLFICDTVGQMLFKFDVRSGAVSSFPFSNFGILGLPYWVTFPLEKVFPGDFASLEVDHVECFNLLPGKVNVELKINIPDDTDLVEPLQEGSIWRQSRGAAFEASAAESKALSSEKVGVAQQWYDEIDRLTFSAPEIESSKEQVKKTDKEMEDGRIRIGCTVNTSPGTSEVIVCAALYLRLKKNPDISNNSRERKASRIADILSPTSRDRRDPLVRYLLKSNRELEDLVLMRPLHVRIKFDCPNHPKAENSKDVILTDSTISVNVVLT